MVSHPCHSALRRLGKEDQGKLQVSLGSREKNTIPDTAQLNNINMETLASVAGVRHGSGEEGSRLACSSVFCAGVFLQRMEFRETLKKFNK